MKEKKKYGFVLIVLFITLCSFTISGISAVFSYLNTGADRASILNLELKNSRVYLPKTTWTSIENPGREMEEETLKKIQKDYLKAWHVKNIALKENSAYGVQDYYTDSAQVHLLNAIKYNKKNKIHVETTTLRHHLKLNFYSADGQLVVFTDENVEKYTQLYKNKKKLTETNDIASYKVLMLLEDGFWRVRHMVKEIPVAKEKQAKENTYATTKNDSILLHGKKFVMKGINYYPQKSPWDMFGEKFDTIAINNDFKMLSKVGLNTIRIFIQYTDFGKAEVLKEKLEKLEKTIQLANKNHLKVVITLFDFYGDYSIKDWTLTHRHAEKIVSTFKNDTTIIAWDIKNEPDLDFESRGKERVLKWLEYMMKEIRKYDENHLITIGWSNFKAANYLKEAVDIVSFHHFNNNIEKDFNALKKKVLNKPILLEEFGVPSYKSIWNLFLGASKKNQATYHKHVQSFLTENNVSHLSWTLYDFKKIPSSVAGKLPWKRNKQKYFGFIDAKGNKKPSFSYINSN